MILILVVAVASFMTAVLYMSWIMSTEGEKMDRERERKRRGLAREPSQD